jgi:hypothetical protein
MQARAMLATLDLSDFFGCLASCPGLACAAAASSPPQREVAHLLRRITASVSLLDDRFGSGVVAEDAHRQVRAPRPHAEQPGARPPFSWQDVLTLYELLETDASIEHIAEPPQGSL